MRHSQLGLTRLLRSSARIHTSPDARSPWLGCGGSTTSPDKCWAHRPPPSPRARPFATHRRRKLVKETQGVCVHERRIRRTREGGKRDKSKLDSVVSATGAFSSSCPFILNPQSSFTSIVGGESRRQGPSDNDSALRRPVRCRDVHSLRTLPPPTASHHEKQSPHANRDKDHTSPSRSPCPSTF
jgi:hypothetical protein